MPFTNPILGGTALVRSAIKSPNYVPGVSGWSINADGTAEFTSLIISGSAITQITITFTDGSQIHAYAGDYTQQITPAFPQTLQGAWITFRPQTVVGKDWNPGAIGTRYSGGVTQQSALEIWSPYDRNLAVDIQSKISLVNRGEPGGGQRSAITLSCEETHIGLPVTGGTPIEIIVDQITLRKDVIITGALTVAGVTTANGDLTLNSTIHNIPSCSLTKTVNYNTNAAWQTVTSGTEEWDIGGLHDTVTNPSRITVARTGIYDLMHYTAFPNNVTNQRGSRILLNGATTLGSVTPQPTTAFSTIASLAFKYLLTAGDYIEQQIFQNSGVTLSTTTQLQCSYFESV